jgi:hypothetical protein
VRQIGGLTFDPTWMVLIWPRLHQQNRRDSTDAHLPTPHAPRTLHSSSSCLGETKVRRRPPLPFSSRIERREREDRERERVEMVDGDDGQRIWCMLTQRLYRTCPRRSDLRRLQAGRYAIPSTSRERI